MEEGDTQMFSTLTEQLWTVAGFWGRQSHFFTKGMAVHSSIMFHEEPHIWGYISSAIWEGCVML